MEFIYTFISDGMDRRPAYGYSHRLRAAVEKPNDTPSPLDYFPEEMTHGRSRGFSFGHRPRISYANQNDTPGPGEYFVEREIPVPRPRNTAWTFGLRPNQKRAKSHSPGPQYMPANHDNSGRGFSFGTSKRPHAFPPRNFDDLTPGELKTLEIHEIIELCLGPGEYYRRDYGRNRSSSNVKGYSFGLRVRWKI